MTDMKSISDRLADRLASLVTQKVEEVLKNRHAHLNFFAQAFIEAVGSDPKDCELVEVREGNTVRWFFRKREGT